MLIKTKTKRALKKNRPDIIILLAFIIGAGFIGYYSQMPEYEVVGINIRVNQGEGVQPLKELEGTIREVSAYNAGDSNQTDSTPCISANGENLCVALELGYKRCATNAFPFGTRLYVEHYGECLVVDRMNSRYKERIDIAMRKDEKERAIKFGVQKLMVYEVN